MAESTVIYDPGQNQGANNVLPWMLASQNGGWGGANNVWPWLMMGSGGFGGFGGWGGINGIVDIFGLAIVAQMFGWNNGGLGGNGAGMAGFISNQLNNDSGRELLMNAITSQGEASRAAVQNLATMLGQDFNLVNAAVLNVQNGISSLALQQAVSVPQIINSIQAGDANLSHQLCECCCNMRQQVEGQGYQNQLRTVEQTGILGNAIAGVKQQIAENRAAQQLSDCQQTYALTDTMNRNYIALDNKIDALESNRKDREITALTAKVAQLESQNFTTGVVGGAIAPVNAALNAIAREVDDIKCKLPQTVSVEWPNLAAVNMTPYVSGGFYQGGFGNGGNYYGPGYGYGYGPGFGFGFGNGFNF